MPKQLPTLTIKKQSFFDLQLPAHPGQVKTMLS